MMQLRLISPFLRIFVVLNDGTATFHKKASRLSSTEAIQLNSTVYQHKNNIYSMLLALSSVLLIAAAWPADASTMAAQPDGACQRRCGDVDIPYSFGIGRGCYLFTGEGDVTFGLTCNFTADGTYRPFCGEALEVLDISLRRSQARVRN
ncbi:hypothetical protein GUJ93_ZPchr0006g43857 [Zizania palustris]|uniref:Wall-associated receptor kinase galacturonan-binding domain-containing protein n=1 Tax=Zizania palustris TaxID=103762 RepID=A0A8J5T0P4_ZIZPA|nr:hypothetical protein GUJ93_ZPchr0006g43857 [Zizania palustris]